MSSADTERWMKLFAAGKITKAQLQVLLFDDVIMPGEEDIAQFEPEETDPWLKVVDEILKEEDDEPMGLANTDQFIDDPWDFERVVARARKGIPIMSQKF